MCIFTKLSFFNYVKNAEKYVHLLHLGWTIVMFIC